MGQVCQECEFWTRDDQSFVLGTCNRITGAISTVEAHVTPDDGRLVTPETFGCSLWIAHV